MNQKDLGRVALYAICLIAAITLVSMYFMTETGAYSWGSRTPNDGYCRCITGPYVVGVGGNPYGGKGMEFQGIMPMRNCIDICGPAKYSWIAK